MPTVPLESSSPFFSSRAVLEPASSLSADSGKPPPSISTSADPRALRPQKNEQEGAVKPEDQRYWGTEKLVLSFDIGSSFSSVTLTHLKWGSAPLSFSPSSGQTAAPIRTVLSYPFSTPSLTPIPSRMPSVIVYDRDDKPRAFGAECLTPEVKERIGDSGWFVVKGWKEQVSSAPRPSPTSSAASLSSAGGSVGKSVLKKSKPGALGLALGRSHTAPSLIVPPLTTSLSHPPSTRTSLHTTSSTSFENLLDAVEARTEVHGPSAPSSSGRLSHDSGGSSSRPILVDGGSGALAGLGEGRRSRDKEREKEKKREKEKVFHGPKLRDIYGDFLKHLVACTRAWFSETTPSGDSLFLRLWPSCVFVVAVPSHWTSAETDLIREGMEKADLLPKEFEVGRLIFAKESAAVVHFARRHTKDADGTWLKEGQSFALCDASEHGVSIIGYTVVSLIPKLKLRAYEPLSRLPSGTSSILTAFRNLLTARLAKTRFAKSPSFTTHLVEEFRTKMLTKYTGMETGEFKLRVQPEAGSAAGGAAIEHDPKVDKWIDTGAKVRDGWMTLSVRDVEECFRPSVDAIIVRLSSILPRGGAKHILLSGGFGESPYLVRRLKETFEPSGCQVIIPDIPTHPAVSEGALRFFLSETLTPRFTRNSIGVISAVDWRTANVPGMHERELYEGSGGSKLVLGKWSEVMPRNCPLDPSRPWRKTYNFRYRLAAQNPVFSLELHTWNTPEADGAGAGEEELFDGWASGSDGKLKDEFHPIGKVWADLSSLVVISEIHGEEGKEWVQLQVDLVIYVGEHTLEAVLLWHENGAPDVLFVLSSQGNETRGPPTWIDGRFY
ncbi:hypothetical protein JCM11251_005387 [Rhodosporidiobolus azoricus]